MHLNASRCTVSEKNSSLDATNRILHTDRDLGPLQIDSNTSLFGNLADATRDGFISWHFRVCPAVRISRAPETYSCLVITV